MTVPPYSSAWTSWLMSASIYEWLRNYLGLTPLRGNCSIACVMSEAASIEWKSYSRPRYNYVGSLPGTTPQSIFKSTTVGTRSLFVSGNQQSETSIRVRKSVLRWRTSKSLTVDALNVSLDPRSPSAMKQWTVCACDCGDCRSTAKTCLFWSACSSGKRRLIVDKVMEFNGL